MLPGLALLLLVLFASCPFPFEEMDDVVIPISRRDVPSREIEISHTAAFNTMGGAFVPPQHILQGEKIRRPPDPEKKDSLFINWFASTDPGERPYDFNIPVGEDMTLYAGWEGGEPMDPLSWAAAFYTHHEDIPPPDPMVIREGGRILRPGILAPGQVAPGPDGQDRVDWVFAGWYADEEFQRTWNFTKNVVQGNTILYAGWEHPVTGIVSRGPNNGAVPAHAIIFNTHCGLVPDPKQYFLDSGETVPRPALGNAGGQGLSAEELDDGRAREGFRFMGWYEEDSTTKWRFSGETNPSRITGATVLGARWVPLYFNITFDSRGGDFVPPVRLDNGDWLEEPAEPKRPGHIFRGWYGHALFDIDRYDAWPVKTILEDRVIYAQWDIDVDAALDAADFPNVPDRGAIVRKAVSAGKSLATVMSEINSGPAGSYSVDIPVGIAPLCNVAVNSGRRVSLRGKGAEASIIKLNGYGPIYTVRNGAALIIRDVALEGRGNNTASLVNVEGELFLESGGRISGNKIYMEGEPRVGWSDTQYKFLTPFYPNPVRKPGSPAVYYNGERVWTGSMPSGLYGGGVCIKGGTFTMNGGVISGNEINNIFWGCRAYGGGVGINGSGTFVMNGGVISNNKVFGESQAYGGGVGGNGSGARFTMNGGTIYGGSLDYNTAYAEPSVPMPEFPPRTWGGGVYLSHAGTFVKNGGVVYGNETGNPDVTDAVRNRPIRDSASGAWRIGSSTRNTTSWAGEKLGL